MTFKRKINPHMTNRKKKLLDNDRQSLEGWNCLPQIKIKGKLNACYILSKHKGILLGQLFIMFIKHNI